MNQKIIFLDTETTGKDQEDRMIQLCYKFADIATPLTQYCKPPVPIKFEAMATHHITNEAIAEAPVFIGSIGRDALQETLKTHILVAHNAPFDIEMLKREGIQVKSFIDTLKVCQYLFDEPMYKLQYFRYRFNLQIEARAHDAEGDVLVLEALFNYLLPIFAESSSAENALEKMQDISRKPAVLKRISFGKYAGKTFEEIKRIDPGYLTWMRGKEDLMKDENLKHTITTLLKK